MFKCFPRHFQQQALLRIHRPGFLWRDAEKCGIKLIDLGQESTPSRVHLSRRSGIAVEIRSKIPSIRRHFGNPVDPAVQQLPVGIEIVAVSRKSATHADYRDGLGSRVFDVLEPGSSSLHGDECSLQSCRVALFEITHSASALQQFVEACEFFVKHGLEFGLRQILDLFFCNGAFAAAVFGFFPGLGREG
jgi:hypothetical protein